MENNQNQSTAQTPPQASQPVTPPPANSNQQGMSHDTKTLIVILLLVFAYPVGLILMWVWMKTWKTIIKVLITVLPIVLTLIWYILFFSIFFAAVRTNQSTDLSGPILVETPTPSPFDQNGTPSPTASPSAVQSVIESALTSETYADLVPYMAESVMFEIEASEGVGPGTPEETVTNLSYLNTAAAPWDFDQTNPIITSIKTQYAQEYGNLFIGISSNDVMSAFGFDQNNKINIIKVAVTYKLLVNE